MKIEKLMNIIFRYSLVNEVPKSIVLFFFKEMPEVNKRRTRYVELGPYDVRGNN